MKILILGAYGFLGTHLSIYLKSKGLNVIRAGRTSSADMKYDHKYDSKKLSIILEKLKPDVIVNLIAFTNVDLCEKYPRQAFVLNTDLPATLVSSVLKSNNQPLIIHISTDQVYCGEGPHTENSNISPCNTYSLTKLFGEYKVESSNTLILRTNFVGKSFATDRPSFSDWIINSLKSNIHIKGFNDIFFSPLHTSSLCSLIKTAIDSRMTGLYNLGCNSGIDKALFMVKLCDELKLDKGLITCVAETAIIERARRPKDMRLDSSKFKKASNVVLPSIDDEICKLADEYRANKFY